MAITAGGHASPDAAAAQASLAARVRAAGAVLLGPNCLGVMDAGEQLELATADLPAGAIGLISQSGNLALELGLLAGRDGLGFSRFASLGNQADLGATELVRALAAHEPTRLIALYLEDFRDGRAFARAAARSTAASRWSRWRSPAAPSPPARSRRTPARWPPTTRRSTRCCAAAGVHRVRTPQELIDTSSVLLRCRPMGGRRVTVLADGGGHGSIAAAEAERHGLTLPELSAELQRSLRAGLPDAAAVSNPVDLAGGAEQDVHTFDRVAHAVLDSGETDALLVTGYFGGYAEYGPEVAAEELRAAAMIAEVATATRRPIVVHTMFGAGAAAAALREARRAGLRDDRTGDGGAAPAGAPAGRRRDPGAARARPADRIDGDGRQLRARPGAAGGRRRAVRRVPDRRRRMPRTRSPRPTSSAIRSCSRRWAGCTSQMPAASCSGCVTRPRCAPPTPSCATAWEASGSRSSGWRPPATAPSC